MVNVLLDFGDDDGWSGYVGAGVGFANVKYDADGDELDIGFRRQRFGVRVAGHCRRSAGRSPPTIDVGLKYRFFNTGQFKYQRDDG